MIRIVIFSLFIGFFSSIEVVAQSVPDKLNYCGIELTFTEGAKNKLRGYISSIYESPRYYNAIVDMADTYMPFIEEAFGDVGAPEDLKYLVIQESSLKADAVSSSNAVGFWQFKVGAASDYGLTVDGQIDERMHIYRASLASGQYFIKANYDFDNWVYAVIAYYEGLTGAVQYTDPQYYGKSKMMVTDNLHWYVMKAIAHKIAYQDALAMSREPRIWIEPFSTEKETSVRKIYESHDLNKEVFLEYNKWIQDENRLPKGNSFTYYIPRQKGGYLGHTVDPNKDLSGLAISTPSPDPVLPSNNNPTDNPQDSPQDETSFVDLDTTAVVDLGTNENPVVTLPAPTPEVVPEEVGKPEPTPVFTPVFSPTAVSIKDNLHIPHVEFNLKDDLQFGIEYILYNGSQLTPEIANMFGKRLASLLEWNGLIPGQEPAVGKIFFLQKPTKSKFHVVEQGEDLDLIAAFHGSSVDKIQKKNRMPKEMRTIFVGQKLYLKKKKSKGEKVIILAKDIKPEMPERPEPIPYEPVKPTTVNLENSNAMPGTEPPIVAPNPVPQNQGSGNEQPGGDQPNNPKTKWVEHMVVPGETLWSISVAYGTKVEIIKLTNKMTSDALKEGMSLRILAKVAKLKEMGIE